MLYKHGRLEKKLREHGRPATAEILSIRTEGQGNSAKAQWSDDSDLTTSWTLCRLQLRVKPQGEAPFEATVRTRLNTLKSQGDTVPVLYDPDDHDKLVVDYELDARRQMEGSAALQARMASERAEMEWAEQKVMEELARRTAQPSDSPSGARGDAERADPLPMDVAESTTAGSVPAGGSQRRLDLLQQLADLHERGVLSDGEFAAEKARILAEH